MPENSKKKIHIRSGCFTKSISNTEQPIPETTQPSLTKSSTTKRQTDFKFKRVYKKTEFQPLQNGKRKNFQRKATTAQQQSNNAACNITTTYQTRNNNIATAAKAAYQKQQHNNSIPAT